MASVPVPKIMLPLRALFDVLSDGVLVTDGAGYRTYANPALNRIVGGDARQPVASLDPPTFLPEDQHPRYWQHLEMMTQGNNPDGVVSLEWEILDERSRRVPVALKLIPVRNGRREPAAIFWLVLDGEDASQNSAGSEDPGRAPTSRRKRELEEGLHRIAAELKRLGFADAASGGLPYGRPELEGLSTREREILELLIGGQRVTGIADHLCLSPHTVRNHLKSIFRKLQVHSQSELINLVRGGEGGIDS